MNLFQHTEATVENAGFRIIKDFAGFGKIKSLSWTLTAACDSAKWRIWQ